MMSVNSARGCLEQPSLHGEQAGGHAVGRVDLRVDMLDVVARGLGRHRQARGDLLRRESPREQSQHFDLARGQPCGGRRAAPPAVARGLENGFDGVAGKAPRAHLHAQ
jgi:hypothetical protein